MANDTPDGDAAIRQPNRWTEPAQPERAAVRTQDGDGSSVDDAQADVGSVPTPASSADPGTGPQPPAEPGPEVDQPAAHDTAASGTAACGTAACGTAVDEPPSEHPGDGTPAGESATNGSGVHEDSAQATGAGPVGTAVVRPADDESSADPPAGNHGTPAPTAVPEGSGAAGDRPPSATGSPVAPPHWREWLAEHPRQPNGPARDAGPAPGTPNGWQPDAAGDVDSWTDYAGSTREPSTDPFGMRRYYGDPAAPSTTRIALPPPTPSRSRSRKAVLLPIVAALVAALLGGGAGGAVGYSLADRGDQARDPSPGVLQQPLPEPEEAEAPAGPVEVVAARVLPSVVQLRVEGRRGSGEGSGMVLSQDGLLLTNNHVVEAAANGGTVTAVFQDGATAPAQIVGRDPSFDLAVLRAGNVSGLTPIELGNSDAVRVGQQVIAFGSPLGLGGTVTTGIISAINRPVSVGGNRAASEATVLNALQTDAAINPGNSGGPLVDMEGKLIGINSAIATTGAEGGSIGVGFSIPVNQAKRVAEELERTGKATRAQLGVGVGDEPNVSGARIRSVEPGSPAEKAGIKAGDLVLRFGGQRILSGEGLQAAVRSRTPGETVEVEMSDRKLSATLGVAS